MNFNIDDKRIPYNSYNNAYSDCCCLFSFYQTGVLVASPNEY